MKTHPSISRSLSTGFFLAIVVLLGAWPVKTIAQAPAEISGFVLVNCVASDQPISATFAGKRVLAESGLASGRATSGLGVPVGPGALQVSHPDFESAELSLEIAPGTTPIVVVFGGKQPAEPGQKAKLVLGQAKSQSSKNASFALVYVAEPDTSALAGEANGKAVQLQPWRPQKIESGSLDLKISGEEVLSTTQEQPEAWYVFVAPKKDKGFMAVGVPQIIYSW